MKRYNAKVNTTNKQKKINHQNLLEDVSEGSKDLSIWSNSFNFAKSGNSKVDPRTGTLLISVKVGLLRSNFGHGPDIDLEMNYNSNVKGNPDHLGSGWAWNLTHYNPVTHQLNTAGGKSFFLKQQPDGSWYPLYHKLKHVIITNNEKGGLIIKSTNGLQQASMITGNIYGGTLFVIGLAAMGAGVAEAVGLLIGAGTEDGLEVTLEGGTAAERGMETAEGVVENDRARLAAILARKTPIDHPTGGKLAVFICCTDEYIDGEHKLFDTPAFSEDEGQLPEHILVNENNVESLLDEVADESYDAILQERRGDYFMLAYKMLKPGERLYVLPQKEGDYADNWDFDVGIYKDITAYRGTFTKVRLNPNISYLKEIFWIQR